MDLIRDLLDNEELRYVLPLQFSQDGLENFFCRARQRWGMGGGKMTSLQVVLTPSFVHKYDRSSQISFFLQQFLMFQAMALGHILREQALRVGGLQELNMLQERLKLDRSAKEQQVHTTVEKLAPCAVQHSTWDVHPSPAYEYVGGYVAKKVLMCNIGYPLCPPYIIFHTPSIRTGSTVCR